MKVLNLIYGFFFVEDSNSLFVGKS